MANNSNYTDKYVYASDSVSAGATLGTARAYLAATGNSTITIFAAGLVFPSTNQSITSKYTHAADTMSAGTALGLARRGVMGCGNTTRGIFSGGYTTAVSTYTDKYTYSGDSVSPGTVLNVEKNTGAASGNSLLGIISGGSDNSGTVKTTSIYTYLTDVVSVGGELLSARTELASASSTPGGF